VQKQAHASDPFSNDFSGYRKSEEGDRPRASTESNPFEAPSEKLSRRQNKDLSHMDLSSVVSPWDNEKGLPAKHIGHSTGSFPVSFVESKVTDPRDRSMSLASQRTVTSSERADSAVGVAASRGDDLLGEWQVNKDRNGLTSSFNRLDLRDKGRVPFDDDLGVYGSRSRSNSLNPASSAVHQLEGRSRSGSSPRPYIPVRKELLEGAEDGLPRAIALYEFAGTEPGDLPFRKGDVIVVTKAAKTDEWWTGKNSKSGATGIFPANHVELVNVEPLKAASHNRRVAPGFE